MRAIIRAAGAGAFALAALHLTTPVTAGAQASCAPSSRAFVADAESGKHQLLARRISIRAGTLPLREALDVVADAARIRLSYAADLLPLSRSVCLVYESATVAQVLADLISDARVRPVVVGGDQIALAADRHAATSGVETPAPIMGQVGLLERVVVTGNTSELLDRSTPAAMSIVTSEKMSDRGSASLSGSLDGAVPGIWMWEQSPLSLLARYGSVRGASSFGVSYPKVYVDGIEVANSLLVTHLDPDAVSRIEVIRGPQGAALHGANAISGVMNIVTRQEGTDNGGARAQLKSRGGTIASDYSASSVLAQSHAATLRHGSNARSARLGASASRIGAFIPGAFSQQLTANGSVRRIGSRSVLTSTFRLFGHDSRSPSSPLQNLSIGSVGDSSSTQSVRQFTVGGTATITPAERWTHSATAGVDGYSLRTAARLDEEYPSAIDSALHAATGSAVRATMKGSSVGRFGDPSGAAATVTFGIEHSVVRDRTTMRDLPEGPAYGVTPWNVNELRSNTGLIAQVGASFRDALFATGGLRVERNTSPTGLGELAALPMLGMTAVGDVGPATIKLRSAYGKAIRPVQATAWSGLLVGLRGSRQDSDLKPEEQAGMEFGADAFIGRSVVLRATRFDQKASGLVQPVSLAFRTSASANAQRVHTIYQLQNVGDVSNTGWEFQGSVENGPWSLGATFSLVDSRVEKLAPSYTGDLRPGDRMLEVPSRTIGLNGSFSQGRWFASSTLARASDWINYDRLAMFRATAGANGTVAIVGSELRSFWKSYEGVTRLGGRAGVGLMRGMTLTLDGENLLDQQRNEPDNITILPGRTLSAGLSIAF